MSMSYSGIFSAKSTPQTLPIPGKDMIANNAGGFGFALDKWKQFERFLILGTERGSFHVGERTLTLSAAASSLECIKEDGVRAVRLIVNVSVENRAPKNDQAIFALALAASFANAEGKKAAYDAITQVCRIGTHLFTFCQAVQDMRGWSRGLRRGVGRFYTQRTAEQLDYQVVKYRQRNGWTHRDVLRLAHPKFSDAKSDFVARYVVNREKSTFDRAKFLVDMKACNGKISDIGTQDVMKKSVAFEKLQLLLEVNKDRPDDFLATALAMIVENELPWEAVPTELHKFSATWSALLPNMGGVALVRNLARMTAVGLLKSNLDEAVHTVCNKLRDPEFIKQSRLHPLGVLMALDVYSQGRGELGKLTWTPVQSILDALNDAVYLAFKNVTPTGKRRKECVDVSGSMDQTTISGTHITARTAAAAMALVAAATEPYTDIVGFSATGHYAMPLGWREGTPTVMERLAISPRMRLDSVIQTMKQMKMGRTDCSLPIEDALKSGEVVDVFVIHTDSESYAGERHVTQALAEYRKKINPNAKVVVVAYTATNITVADPDDAGMMDVVGFDASVPEIVRDFIVS